MKGSNWAMIYWMRRSGKKEEYQKKEKDHDAR